MQWLAQTGRIIMADLLRHDKRDPTEFFTVKLQLINFGGKSCPLYYLVLWSDGRIPSRRTQYGHNPGGVAFTESGINEYLGYPLWFDLPWRIRRLFSIVTNLIYFHIFNIENLCLAPYYFLDLQRPPSAISALLRNPFMSRSMKESTLNNLIWSMIKVKRGRLQASSYQTNFDLI